MTSRLGPLLVVGASARAVAQSAAAAGFEVSAIDLFNDADLLAVAGDVRRSHRFPSDVLPLQRELPPGPWLYTGGLENYPRLVERITNERPLLGCTPAVLRQVRDVGRIARFATRCDSVVVPEFVTADDVDGDRVPAGPWLVKRRRSSGGLGVERWAPTEGPLPRGSYLQREITGTSYGASFLSNGNECRFLGLAEQLAQPAADGSAPFRYAGSITLPMLAADDRERLTRLGQSLVEEFGSIGLFGVDLIRTSDGRWYLLEVNPRPTASMELWEPAGEGPSLIELHARIFLTGRLPQAEELPRSELVRGKLVVYSRGLNGRVPKGFTETLLQDSRRSGETNIADIPAAGTSVEPDQPLITVLLSSPDRDDLLLGLRAMEREMLRTFVERLEKVR
ncbi:MAG: ATP-grasp domain-containing protein [Planctomycetes bacterium]|nr:ATP-grasp domain-containing protein [Planctomycetota bacterium]